MKSPLWIPIDDDLCRTKGVPEIIVSHGFDATFSKDDKYGARGLILGMLAAWLLLGAVVPDAGAQTAAEKPRTIRVVLDDNYPPYSFRSDEGNLQGILIDQWQAWQKETGIKAELHAMDWSDALGRMRAGEFDVIGSIVETAARREYFDFGPPFAVMEVPIFFRKEISGITDLASLKGFPVAVKAGDQRIDVLRANGVVTLIPFQNHDAIVTAASQRKIAVFIFDAPSALYHLSKAGIEDQFRQSAPVFRDQLRRAVRKGDAATLRMVSEGFAAIGPDELRRIDEKWFGRTVNRYENYIAYAAYVGTAGLLLVTGLAAWNRMLRNKIQQRTLALRESEQRFRQIAENIHEVFWLTTVDLSKILYISPAYAEVSGQSCESLYQSPRSFIAAIHFEDRARTIAVVETDREHGFETEFRIVRLDGTIRWILARGFPIRDEEAHIYRIAGIAQDITERKRAVELVQQAEDRIRLVIDTIPTLAWSVRPDGAMDFVNRRWLDYTGKSFEEEVENPAGAMHPDDVARVMDRWREDMAANRPFESELRLRRADGEYRWFLVRTDPLRDEHGNIIKWFGAGIDIEDRKMAEETLQHGKRQLHALVERLHTAREEESKRIARELHDDLGQQLTALNLQLDDLEIKLAVVTPDQRDQIAGMHAVVDRTIKVVQTIASELRLGQLDILGLTAAIDWQLKEFSRRSAIRCEVTHLDEITNLSDVQNTTVFRILQEALTNIVRHAEATRVQVSLRAGRSHLTLKIHDDGRGITTAELNDRKAIGLLGMRERAEIVRGTITITGEARKGTTVLVTIPLKQTEPISL